MVFIVLPDEALRFPFGYSIDEILFLQLSQFGRLSVAPRQVRLEPAKSGLRDQRAPNLRYSGFKRLADTNVNGRPLMLMLDAGARSSALTSRVSSVFLKATKSGAGDPHGRMSSRRTTAKRLLRRMAEGSGRLMACGAEGPPRPVRMQPRGWGKVGRRPWDQAG